MQLLLLSPSALIIPDWPDVSHLPLLFLPRPFQPLSVLSISLLFAAFVGAFCDVLFLFGLLLLFFLLMMDFCLDSALFSAVLIVQVMHFCQLVVCFLVGCFPLLFPVVTMAKCMYFLYVSLYQKE